MTTAREILLDPIVRERRVLELWPEHPDGDLRLSAQTAREWSVLAPETPPLPVADSDLDVVLALSAWWLDGGADRRAAWLVEMDRVLSPEGALLLDMGPPPGAEGSPAAGALPLTGQAQLVEQLRQRFGWVVEVAEASFLGACFLVAETEDMAVAGDLSALAQATRRRLVIAARQPQPAWQLRESLLIPMPDPGQDQRLRALIGEVDELREQVMGLLERNEQLELALGSLRRDSERHLGLLARSESATELSILERDRARRRAEAAERAMADAEVALRRRNMEVAALEREVASREVAMRTGSTGGAAQPGRPGAAGAASLPPEKRDRYPRTDP